MAIFGSLLTRDGPPSPVSIPEARPPILGAIGAVPRLIREEIILPAVSLWRGIINLWTIIEGFLGERIGGLLYRMYGLHVAERLGERFHSIIERIQGLFSGLPGVGS